MLLQSWIKYLKQRMDIHKHLDIAETRKQARMNIIVSMAGVSATLVSFVGLGIDITRPNQDILGLVMSALVVIFNFCSLLSTAINNSYRWGEDSVKHENAYKAMVDVVTDIQLYLKGYKIDTEEEHLRAFKTRIDQILRDAPVVEGDNGLLIHMELPSSRDEFKYEVCRQENLVEIA